MTGKSLNLMTLNYKLIIVNFNIPFFTLYNYCQGQYIMGPGGPVALCMLAVNQAMDDYQIDKEEKIEFSLKVRRIANVIISAQAEEAAEELKRQNKAR